MRRLVLVAGIAAAAAGLDSCGGGGSSGSDQVVVSGASSLQLAFENYASQAGIDAKQSFGGSDDLAAQIRQGVKPDVYAAANTSLPDDLFKAGLVEKPRVFATNILVAAVPKDSSIKSVDDLAAPGTSIAIGAKGVPAGDYAREVVGNLPNGEGQRILGNVASEEPDVAGIVGKLTQGGIDAGFLYITDVMATKGQLEAISIPESIAPKVAYGVAVVKDADNPDGAKQFVDGLFGSGQGASALKSAGFGPPPG